MDQRFLPATVLAQPLVRLHQDTTGVTAQVVGLPEVQATAATRDEALAQVQRILFDWLSSGQLVPLPIPPCRPEGKVPSWAKDDQLEQEFLADLARLREEDLEQTLREQEEERQGCPSTSSTPTT